MKTFRYAAIFLLVFLTFMVVHGYNTNVYSRMVHQKTEYNHALDSAMDAAVEGIVESADGNNVTIDFEQCVDNFYRDLFASFGAIDSPVTQAKLELYTPILAIADVDGLYVYYSDIANEQVVRNWSQKIPYSYSGSTDGIKYSVNFTMSDEVTIVIDGINTVYSGHYSELSVKYPASYDEYKEINRVIRGDVLGTSGAFQSWRHATISNTIVKELNYYVNRHNLVASAFGEQFTFELPLSAESTISRGIEDVSFMSFFQGYPFGSGTSSVYSQFEISGARVSKGKGYYVQVVDDYLYYHQISCRKGEGYRDWYATREESAMKGALPCPYCNP